MGFDDGDALEECRVALLYKRLPAITAVSALHIYLFQPERGVTGDSVIRHFIYISMIYTYISCRTLTSSI